MSRIDIDNLSYSALVTLREHIANAIAAKRAVEAQTMRHKLQELAAKSGFSAAELFGGKRAGRKGRGLVKFRNPKNPYQTWSGRGRKPNWLVEATKNGAKLETFAA